MRERMKQLALASACGCVTGGLAGLAVWWTFHDRTAAIVVGILEYSRTYDRIANIEKKETDDA